MTRRHTAQAPVERTVGIVVAGLVGFVGLIGSQTAAAQDSGAVNVDVAECIDLKSPEERFACYEKRVGATLEQGATPTGNSAAPTTPAAAVATPAAAVATPAAAAATAAAAPAVKGEKPVDQAPPEIVSTVTALRETVPNNYMITLDNGQVWRQTQPKVYPLQVGHEVRLYATRWGDDYRLSSVERRGFIQVERVR